MSFIPNRSPKVVPSLPSGDKYSRSFMGQTVECLRQLTTYFKRFIDYFSLFQEKAITDATGKSFIVLAKSRAGSFGDRGLWSVRFVTGGVNISVPVCRFSKSTDPQPYFYVNGVIVDYIDPTKNFLPCVGVVYLLLRVTVDDNAPYVQETSRVDIMAFSAMPSNTLTQRYIPIIGVDATNRTATAPWLQGAIQTRRDGDRNQTSNMSCWSI